MSWTNTSLVWSLLLVVPVVLIVALLEGSRLKKRCQSVFGEAWLKAMRFPHSPWRWCLKALLVTCGVATVILALARPRYGFDWQEVETSGENIVVILDISKSMTAQDTKPDRLTVAKRKIFDLTQLLSGGDRVGLVVFAGFAYVQCPLTNDYDVFNNFVGLIDTDLISQQGSNLADALKIALTSLRDTKSTGGSQGMILLLSDGEDHDSATQEAMELASKQGVKVSALGFGTLEGAPLSEEGGGFKKTASGEVVISKLQEKSMRLVADKTGGIYRRAAATDADLQAVLKQGLSGETQLGKVKREKRWHERFQWFLFLSVAFLLADYLLPHWRRGRLKSTSQLLLLGALMVGMGAGYSEARAADDEKDDRQAADAYNKGVDQYRQGQFGDAAKAFAEGTNSKNQKLKRRSLFNLGNAEAMNGNVDGAISAYEELLQHEPTNKNAQDNLAYLKERKKQQQNQGQNDQKQKDQQDKQGEKNKDKNDQQDKSGDPSKDKQNSDQQKNPQDKNQDSPKPQNGEQNEKNQNQEKQAGNDSKPQKQNAKQDPGSGGGQEKQDSQQNEPSGGESLTGEGEQADPRKLTKQQAEALVRSIDESSRQVLMKPRGKQKNQADKNGKDW